MCIFNQIKIAIAFREITELPHAFIYGARVDPVLETNIYGARVYPVLKTNYFFNKVNNSLVQTRVYIVSQTGRMGNIRYYVVL